MSTHMFINRLYKSNRCKYPGCDASLGTGLYYYGNQIAICSRCFHSMYPESKENIANYLTPPADSARILKIANNMPFLNQREPENDSIKASADAEAVAEAVAEAEAKPSPISWLVYEEGTRGPDYGVRGTNFDWDENGLWFSGDAGMNTPAYPVYTRFTIAEKDRVEISVDFIYDDYETR